MKTSVMVQRAVLLAAMITATAVQARNEGLLLPIEPALQAASSQLNAGVRLQFGSETAEGLQPLIVVTVVGVGRPNGQRRSGYTGSPTNSYRSDPEMCQEAFDKAVVELQRRTQVEGGVAAVGIVSSYNGTVMNKSGQYECRVGMTQALVGLQAKIVSSLERTSAPPAPVVAPAVQAQGVPAGSPSGYAAIHEISKVPFLDEAGRKRYSEWLLAPTPRAVALHPSGRHAFSSGQADAIRTALSHCEQSAQAPCFLYAVDEQVVWSADPSRRLTRVSLDR